MNRCSLAAAVDALNLPAVESRTVHSSQGNRNLFPSMQFLLILLGAEWEYIILSCVRSRQYEGESSQDARSCMQHSFGLIKDRRCLNVALTRARSGLIILGTIVIFCFNFFLFLQETNRKLLYIQATLKFFAATIFYATCWKITNVVASSFRKNDTLTCWGANFVLCFFFIV